MFELIWAILAMVLTHGRVEGPANGVYAGGAWGTDQKAEGIAAAAVTPGAILVTGSTDGQVQEAGARAIAIVGVAAENIKFGIESFLTDHASGDPVQYYSKPGTEFFGIIKNSSAALVYGDLLQTAANGELEKFDPAVDPTSLATVDSSASAAYGTSVARYIGRADVTPPASGVNRYLCALGGA